jgi:fructose-specific component phosphotransferase system IIB-like protein
MGADADCGRADIGGRIITINSANTLDIKDTLLHELLEAALHRRGCRYVNSQDELIFTFTHREFTNISEDVSGVFLALAHQIESAG